MRPGQGGYHFGGRQLGVVRSASRRRLASVGVGGVSKRTWSSRAAKPLGHKDAGARVRAVAVCAAVGSLVTAMALVAPGAGAATTGGMDVISTVAGGGASASLANGAVATAVTLGSPVMAVYDSHGNVVIADQNNNLIRVVAATTGTFYGVAMTAGHIYTVVGFPDPDNQAGGYAGDGNCPKGKCVSLTGGQVLLSDPNGVAVDAAGDMAITDTGNGAVRFVAATSGMHFGINMTAGGIYTVATADGTITTDPEQANAAALAEPDGIAFDAQGDIVVADTDNNVIRLIPNAAHVAYGQDVQPGFIYDIAGNANYGFTGNGTPGTSAELSLEPLTQIAVDSAGNIAFPDSDNEVIRMVAASNGSYHGRRVVGGDIYTIVGQRHRGLQGGNKKSATVGHDRHPPGRRHRLGRRPVHQGLGEQHDPLRAGRQRRARRQGRRTPATSTPTPGTATRAEAGTGDPPRRPPSTIPPVSLSARPTNCSSWTTATT